MVISFFDWPIEKAREYEELFKVIEELVLPVRQQQNREARKKYWWHFAEKATGLYHAIGWGSDFAKHPKDWHEFTKPEHVFACSEVGKYLIVSSVPNDMIFSHSLIVFCNPDFSELSMIQSSIHEVWARRNASGLGMGLRYTPVDCYMTFPFPKYELGGAMSQSEDTLLLSTLGSQLDSHRRSITIADQIGLTQLYNRFHDKSNMDGRIEKMRQLQVKIDNAVRDAYGWTDLDLGHGFHKVGYLPENDNIRFTISEPARVEVLKRLAKLNKERWEEEAAAGLHKKGKAKK